MSYLVVGIILLLIAVALVFIDRPNKAGRHPQFLQFEASLVLFPPVVLTFFALGMAAIISSLLGISR